MKENSLSVRVIPPLESLAVFLSFMAGSAMTFCIAVLESSWRNANIDELTELPGRRALKQHLGTLGSFFSIAMVDFRLRSDVGVSTYII